MLKRGALQFSNMNATRARNRTAQARVGGGCKGIWLGEYTIKFVSNEAYPCEPHNDYSSEWTFKPKLGDDVRKGGHDVRKDTTLGGILNTTIPWCDHRFRYFLYDFGGRDKIKKSVTDPLPSTTRKEITSKIAKHGGSLFIWNMAYYNNMLL